jgi:DNA-binding NarL/FixJ family response regulator
MSDQTSQADRSSISVVLVDDHEAFLNIAASFLRRHEEVSVVGAFTRSQEALSRMPALRPHVILFDLNMPSPNGLEAIPLLREALPNSGIIALSLLDGRMYEQAALEAGADAFVAKSDMISDLLPAIHRVMEEHQHRVAA